MADAIKAHEKPIALVGLMGAGKSTVGRRLAKRLGLPFADTDREIEVAAGLRVAEIFKRFGEAHFRDGERRVIARLVEGPPRVIATGGGAFVDDTTRALLLDRCTVIWLDVEIDVLVERLNGSSVRPLLNGTGARAVLERQAEARGPVYAQAHIVIKGDATVERIVEALVAT